MAYNLPDEELKIITLNKPYNNQLTPKWIRF